MASLAELEANLGGWGGGTGTTGLWGRFSLLTVYVLHFFVYHDVWKVLSSKVSLCRALTHHQTREETEPSVLELMALQSVLFTLELTTRYPVSHLYDLNYNWSSQCTIISLASLIWDNVCIVRFTATLFFLSASSVLVQNSSQRPLEWQGIQTILASACQRVQGHTFPSQALVSPLPFCRRQNVSSLKCPTANGIYLVLRP